MKILVVDDQKANQIMLHGLLTQIGHQVTCVDNGSQALAVFAQFEPQIVLLDIIMPVMDGFETAPELKKLSGSVHLPIIFITALEAKDTLLKCLEVGGDDFLSIPFEPVVLKAKINAHARVRELSHSLALTNETLKWHSNRMEREQAVVQHMLHNAMHDNELDQPFVQTFMRSVSAFNGDLCLGKGGPFGNYYLFLGDFTGHGLASATGTLPVAQAFFGMAQRGLSVNDMASELNLRLLNLLPDDMFCAAIIVEFSAGGERLTVWNGGIPDAVILSEHGDLVRLLKSRHMALGILPAEQFDHQVEHLVVNRNDYLVAFTDGVIEIQVPTGGMLGEERFVNMLRHAWRNEGEQSFNRVSEQLQQLTVNDEQDDLSLVAVQCTRLPPPQKQVDVPHNHLPFTLKISIRQLEMQRLDPIQQLVDSLGKLEALKPHKTTLYLLFAECFNNILDHNVLQLDSSIKEEKGFEYYYEVRQQRLQHQADMQIDFEIFYDPNDNMLRFEVGSNGTQPFPEGAEHLSSVSNEEKPFGRGLSLLEHFADTVEWRARGQSLFVVYDLNRPPF
ncbi:MAG: SpoIIE family protein phosphatase [Pseudomonadota bacterium]